MIQSLIVYGIFGLLLFLFGRKSFLIDSQDNFSGTNIPFWTKDVLGGLFVFAFFSGIRWNVGVDYQAYYRNFLKIQHGRNAIFNWELGFDYLTHLFAELGIHFTFYFGFLAFLQLFFIYYAFKNDRYLYPFLGVIILFGPEYLNWMNGIRQMIAASMFLYSIKYIQQRKLLIFLSIIFLASFFHKSAIILVFFYIIPLRNYFNNRLIVFILYGITILIGFDNSWIEIFNNFGALLDFVNYENISSKLNVLILDNQIRSFGPRRIVLISLSFILIWLSPKLFSYFKGTLFYIYYNYSILGALLFNLLGNTHHIFIRPLNYFIIFFVPILAYLLVYLNEHSVRNRFKFYIVFFLILAYLPLSILSEIGKGKYDYVNYKFFWERPVNIITY